MKRLLKFLSVVLFLIITAVVSYTLGTGGYFKKSKVEKYEFVESYPPRGLLLPGSSNCAEPNQNEKSLVKAAVDILGFSDQKAGSLSTGAQQFLSRTLFSDGGAPAIYVCDIPAEYERAAQLIRNSGDFWRGRIVEYQLNLIARLPNQDAAMAAVVAESAFSEKFQESEYFRDRDIRPFSRATLASMGLLARPYADKAFAQVSIEDSMGTGAAQIAVAGQHPMALQAVEKLMAAELAAIPKGSVVPHRAKSRLYEMAYALSFGGEQAKRYIGPFVDLMGREVESWAPPFGMVNYQPRRMCPVLAKILKVQVADLEFSYCKDAEPIDQ